MYQDKVSGQSFRTNTLDTASGQSLQDRVSGQSFRTKLEDEGLSTRASGHSVGTGYEAQASEQSIGTSASGQSFKWSRTKLENKVFRTTASVKRLLDKSSGHRVQGKASVHSFRTKLQY